MTFGGVKEEKTTCEVWSSSMPSFKRCYKLSSWVAPNKISLVRLVLAHQSTIEISEQYGKG